MITEVSSDFTKSTYKTHQAFLVIYLFIATMRAAISSDQNVF